MARLRVSTKKDQRISRLGWAWIGLAVVLVAGSAFGWQAIRNISQETEAAIAIQGQPDKFAIPENDLQVPDAPLDELMLTQDTKAASATATPETETESEPFTLTDVTDDRPTSINLTPVDPVDVETEKSLLTRLSENDAPGIVVSAMDLPTPEEARQKSKIAQSLTPPPTGRAPGPLRSDMISGLGLPKQTANHAPATYYARSFSDAAKRPMVGLVVGGLGLDPALTRRAIRDLPPEVSLAFAPYAKNLDLFAQEARNAGHEVFIELPMEAHNAGAEALGPAGLLTSYTPTENRERLVWILSRAKGYAGVINYMGQKYISDDLQFRTTLDMVRASGLSFIDDTGLAKPALDQANIRSGNVDIILAEGALSRQLAALEKAAENQRAALGRAFISPSVISTIQDWTRTRDKDRTALAPASAILAVK